MPKVKISEYSATANSNTDVASINIDEGCAPSGINNAIRAVMGHLKDFQQGTNGDPFNGPVNGTLGATTASTAVVTTLNSTDATDASSTTAAAMKTAGGLGVAKKMFVGLDANIYGLTVGRGAGAVATNTAVGASALAANVNGYGNAAFGYNSLLLNNDGYSNTGFGRETLRSNLTGANNLAVGREALYSNTTASNNTAVGYQAGYNATGAGNTFSGYQAGFPVTAGANNTLLGIQAGFGTTNLTTGANNTLIGAGASTSAGGDNYSITISCNSVNGKGTGTGFIAPGSGSSGAVYQGNNSTLWSVTSDQRLKKNIVDNNTGLEKITAIQVRNFEYRLPEEITELPQDQAVKKQGVQLGVIAQELQQVLPECVKTESTGVMSVDADNLTWYMINAIKELKAEVDSLKSQLNGA